MAKLTPAELFKYDWRVEIFLKKYTKGQPFETTAGLKTFVPDETIIRAIKRGDSSTLNRVGLIDAKGQRYPFGTLEKTAEFGGKGAGAGTAKQDRELLSLQNQLDDIRVQIAKATVPIKIGNATYEIAGAETTPGTPKSDFHLLDNNGKEIVWISHKDGRTAKDFQQWGGMSERVEPAVFRHRETQAFIAAVQQKFDNQMPSATTVARRIQDQKLKNLAIYGNKYGGPLGRQNVTLVIQGPVKLTKSGNAYQFTSNHVHVNGERITGDFEPVFMAIYKGDRSNFGVRGARFAIQPAGSRRVTEYI